jgi:hypothetical protein
MQFRSTAKLDVTFHFDVYIRQMYITGTVIVNMLSLNMQIIRTKHIMVWNEGR